MHILEGKQASMETNSKIKAEEVDNSIAAIGGFNNKSLEEAEGLLKELLIHVDGFHDVSRATGYTRLVLQTCQDL